MQSENFKLEDPFKLGKFRNVIPEAQSCAFIVCLIVLRKIHFDLQEKSRNSGIRKTSENLTRVRMSKYITYVIQWEYCAGI
jgi:hypothetical protein